MESNSDKEEQRKPDVFHKEEQRKPDVFHKEEQQKPDVFHHGALLEMGIYVHIPFCQKKCTDCNYCTAPLQKDVEWVYIQALEAEIERVSHPYLNGRVKSIYFGGGTPSLVSDTSIKKILNTLRHLYVFCEDIEITVEAKPCSVTMEKVFAYQEMGINRISLGVQALQEKLLMLLGRTHRCKDIQHSFQVLKTLGFKNVNVEVLYGIPGQRLCDFEETLKFVIEQNVQHVSCYGLGIEEDTVLGELLSQKKLIPMDDEIERRMFHRAEKMLQDAGFLGDDIFSFAKKGFFCQQSAIYNSGEAYLGFGVSASSYMQNSRYTNTQDLSKYIQGALSGGSVVAEKTFIQEEDRMKEFMFVGLHRRTGVCRDDFFERFQRNLHEIFQKELFRGQELGYLEWVDSRVRLTQKGLDFSSQVFSMWI